MVHRSFAQRAWLPQERGRGLAGPAFLTGEDSERVVGVQAPLWQEARQGWGGVWQGMYPTQSWAMGAARVRGLCSSQEMRGRLRTDIS